MSYFIHLFTYVLPLPTKMKCPHGKTHIRLAQGVSPAPNRCPGLGAPGRPCALLSSRKSPKYPILTAAGEAGCRWVRVVLLESTEHGEETLREEPSQAIMKPPL
jgi:hypothetical protein